MRVRQALPDEYDHRPFGRDSPAPNEKIAVVVVLRHRWAWAGLISALARHPGQVEEAIALLLPRLSSHEVEQVSWDWDPDRYTRTATDAPAPPVPQDLSTLSWEPA
ncbi:hypothetical protein [Streptomyces sp. NPDC008121]|uniref:hypothetical protein n=1 Tax=Streptomyces sp. NPDC008121 TaxID=3364809 RepID=UPI0036EE347D